MLRIEAQNLPSHIGIIMDGNGRWAEERGEERSAGHRAGSRSVRRMVRLCIGIDDGLGERFHPLQCLHQAHLAAVR